MIVLLYQDAEVEAKKDNREALHMGATGGHMGVVKLLLDRGAEIETKDDDSSTALHIAAVARSIYGG